VVCGGGAVEQRIAVSAAGQPHRARAPRAGVRRGLARRAILATLARHRLGGLIYKHSQVA
jgi:hypothetical protein